MHLVTHSLVKVVQCPCFNSMFIRTVPFHCYKNANLEVTGQISFFVTCLLLPGSVLVSPLGFDIGPLVLEEPVQSTAEAARWRRVGGYDGRAQQKRGSGT